MKNLDAIQQASQAQFDRQSSRYGKTHILAQVDDVEKGLEKVPASSGKKALDVATGGGHTGLYLAAHGYEVTLADLAEGMLKQASLLAAERGLSVEVRQHAAEELPYPDATFDLVTCRVAAHHFTAPDRFVSEVARILKPGGSFLLIDGSIPDNEPEAEDWIHRLEKLRDPSHHRFLAPKAWIRLCESFGLHVLDQNLTPLKQPDLEWYFETAATPPENRAIVRTMIAEIAEPIRAIFKLGEEDGKIVWWWHRLTLVAQKSNLLKNFSLYLVLLHQLLVNGILFFKVDAQFS
jgi:ubiquinone/menaquinone biosynthesis C-methylase UbiE